MTTSKTIAELMSHDPVTLTSSNACIDAALAMRDHDIGEVLVTDVSNNLSGIVTDRDLVVRVLCEGRDPTMTMLGDIATSKVVSVQEDDGIDDVMDVMARHAIRRVPVVDGDTLRGIISLGDLAAARDPRSVLGRISRAAPNN